MMARMKRNAKTTRRAKEAKTTKKGTLARVDKMARKAEECKKKLIWEKLQKVPEQPK